MVQRHVLILQWKFLPQSSVTAFMCETEVTRESNSRRKFDAEVPDEKQIPALILHSSCKGAITRALWMVLVPQEEIKAHHPHTQPHRLLGNDNVRLFPFICKISKLKAIDHWWHLVGRIEDGLMVFWTTTMNMMRTSVQCEKLQAYTLHVFHEGTAFQLPLKIWKAILIKCIWHNEPVSLS